MNLRFVTTAERRVGSLSNQRSVAAQQAAAHFAAGRRWLIAALAFTALFIGRTMAPALNPNVIQDDARQHVFWIARLRDPELFRNDLIADYYQAVAPPAYSGLYWALSWGVDLLVASKLLPPVLGLVSALFTFLLARRLHPSAAGAFLATVLLSWYVWQYDDLASATPRAFLLPLLAAQLWALVAGRLVLAVGLVTVAALFYPVGGALGLALLGVRLVGWQGWRPTLTRQRSAWVAFLAAGALVGVALVPSQLAVLPFGPGLSAAEARKMADFGPGGRFPFFVTSPYAYWLASARSGLDLRLSDGLFLKIPVLFEYAALAAVLPLLLLVRRRLPGVERLNRDGAILLQLLIASFGLFFLAHVLLFHLYVPSRYVKWSVPLALAVAAGLALGILIEALAARVRSPRRRLVVGGLALGLGLALALYPGPYFGAFAVDEHPTITAYLRAQPKHIVVAGVPIETDLIPSLAARRVLTDREHVYAWHLGYYREMRRRTDDLIKAYYADSAREVAAFASRYEVELFLVNRAAFGRETFEHTWTGNPTQRFEPFISAASRELAQPKNFTLLELASHCAVVDDGEVAVVPRTCLDGAG
jgi:hypothetical protein